MSQARGEERVSATGTQKRGEERVSATGTKGNIDAGR